MTDTPKGYTPVEQCDNPNPIAGWENAETRWTHGDTNYLWKDGTLYEKPAPTQITTQYINHPAFLKIETSHGNGNKPRLVRGIFCLS